MFFIIRFVFCISHAASFRSETSLSISIAFRPFNFVQDNNDRETGDSSHAVSSLRSSRISFDLFY